jgi:hypothetical protein
LLAGDIELPQIQSNDSTTNDIHKFRQLAETLQIGSTAQALWYALIELKYSFNYTGWFKASNSTLQSKLGITDKTLAKARSTLVEKGLIQYKSNSNKRVVGEYYMNSLEDYYGN